MSIGVKLRGAFDPKIQTVITMILIAVAVWFAMVTVNANVEPRSAQLDLQLLPVGLVLGMAVGVPVGIWRLRALRKAKTEIGDQFFLTQATVIGRFREGANATTLQRAAIGWAFLVWFVLTAFTHGRVILNGSLAFYIVGQFLTGQTLPFLRFWVELHRNGKPNG